MEDCPICDGSGLLLTDTCPLCEDAASWDSESVQPCSESLSSLCLVLDIDGTLLSECTPEDVNASEMRKFLRPHLHEFLDFAFKYFRAIGIWTAASESWLRVFLRAVDPTGQRNWAFTWSGRISRVLPKHPEHFYPACSRRKKLSKIWENKTLRSIGYTRHSTLIIENTPEVCQSNYGNAIYVRTYGDSWPSEDRNDALEEGDKSFLEESDDWLLALQKYLTKLISVSQQGVPIRSIDKRYWYKEISGTSSIDRD
eukprot:gnl/MRDRNA2_/MRDRNA2_108941_c0_seq1.p1 gnl/MRDRNA2_/MRDRNA2_108941_c0~~gnl/MRDRNA2_/MRDRNA2_108941_c0_seq1.p1  ORF type:complete len:255 (+),score=22.19 gnl/MRDRNA2_/MRDRNA2_108941_c0_seq1:47-811(+)